MLFRLFLSGWLVALLSLAAAAQTMGRVEHLPDFASKFVQPRHVDVWLPEGYVPGKKYPVLYMHDGQNLFSPKTSYGGVAWEVDSVLTQLQREKKVPAYIVVGIWNSPKRFAEYTPEKPFRNLPPARQQAFQEEYHAGPLSDAYLKFLVEELKPYIDQHYQTKPDRKHTFIMGSSMGGLISLYAALEYPQVFGGAGCLSTHWPLSLQSNTPDFTNAMVQYLEQKLPRRHKPRLYFDYGTTTLDALYEPHQQRIDAVLRARGYDARHWQTRRFEGAAHNEAAWQQRLTIPLEFLLGKK
ncbi:alpha/beta hydrolase [Hymenobacter sp. BT730]|uniref:alpha/beta hydrolase n=1 Tax=Hymenobacter sp. BT730 TaxID=3063332 RepID=UPI0026DF0C5E|nr:alpha/beta hydrolase-fold protein [Hymenobacter sp. BT730]